MGMSASQANLGFLLSRKNTIGRQLTTLSNDKMRLSDDMSKVSKEYQEALNTKVLKWSNNAGVSYVDLSYNNLMTPGATNQNTPYLITDTAGRVVVDSKYQKYAEMISENGMPGGDWASNRAEILSSVTGIPAESIEEADSAQSTLLTSSYEIAELESQVAKAKEEAYNKNTASNFCQYLGNIPSSYHWNRGESECSVKNGYDQAKSGSCAWRLTSTPEGSKAALKQLCEVLCKNVKNYLTDEDFKAFQSACDTVTESYVFKSDVGSDSNLPVMIDNGEYCITVDKFIDSLMAAYEAAGGTTMENSSNPNLMYYCTVDKNSSKYQTYLKLQAQLDAAKEAYDGATDTSNQIFTAEQEAQIEFYDTLFSSIAEKGWVANDNVQDTDYLNQMLQNNLYTITTVSRSEECDCKEGIHYVINSYDTDIASNCTNVFMVNDSDLRAQALAEYEHKKSLINKKENMIDTRMQDLQTEQSAINQMIQGIETVRNDNVERTFSIFG